MSDSASLGESNSSSSRQWFVREYFEGEYMGRYSSEKFRIIGVHPRRRIVFNPRFPNIIEELENDFPLLKELANSYTAIDALTKPDGTGPLTYMEAVEYIINFDRKWVGARPVEDIDHWAEYLKENQRMLSFAPNFTLWDKYTREFEDVAMTAIKESERILDAYRATKKRFNEDIRKGVYIRVYVLQRWIEEVLNPTRARDDYRKWKSEQTAATPTSQVRRRKDRNNKQASPTIELTHISHTITPGTRAKHSRLQKLSRSLHDDITIWILSLTIYFSCTIIQAISFNETSPSPPSLSDYLNNLQTTLTQALSVFLTYTLSDRAIPTKTLSLRFKVWIMVALILPIVAAIMLRWHVGMSGLLSFIGTVVNGCLQITLAIGIKKSTLPS